jgi:tRNA(fMet)-specific endonuclease VapC
LNRVRIWIDPMRYLLDTNVCVDYLTGRYPMVAERLCAIAPGDVTISAIAVAELRYGADKSARTKENHIALDTFLENVATLDFDRDAAACYGVLRSMLEKTGTPIGPNDMLIAAQALASNTILVTDNVSEFERVAGLTIDNWRE